MIFERCLMGISVNNGYLISPRATTLLNIIIKMEKWNEAPFNAQGKIPQDTETFWSGILSKHPNFRELATYSLTCLLTPVSNAVVELTFSLVTSIKTKLRNRMQLKLLESHVRIRSHLIHSNKCCKDFIVTPDMLERFNAKQVYEAVTSSSSSKTSPDEEQMLLKHK